MEIKGINETKNPVFDRKEIQAVIVSDVSPSNKETLALLSKKFSVPEDSIKIKGIYGEFGTKSFKLKANIYKSKQDREKIERKTKKEIESEKKQAEETKKAAEEEKKTEEATKETTEEKPEEAAKPETEEKTE